MIFQTMNPSGDRWLGNEQMLSGRGGAVEFGGIIKKLKRTKDEYLQEGKGKTIGKRAGRRE
jgi:hypothetical protein